MEESLDGSPHPWCSRALCFYLVQSGTPADLWYSDDPEEQAMAAGACFQCPVRLECLKQAADNKETYGIWGGLKPEQRLLNGRHRAYSSLKGIPNEQG